MRSFSENLKRLQNALQQAIDSRSQLSSLASPLPEDSLDTAPLNALVGDYQATLKTCRKFLEQNASFERNDAGVIKRIHWSSQLADKITEMRNRITFHNVRLMSILRPLELTLYTRLGKDIANLHQEMRAGFTDTRAGIAEILSRLDQMEGVRLGNVRRETEQAAQPLPELPRVSTYLRASFAHAAQFVQGVHITDQIRLSSIIGHFTNGTHRVRPGIGETLEPLQYVNLWKSVWIMQQLKSSATFDEFTASELNASLIKEHERLMLDEMARFNGAEPDLIAPHNEEIENLSHNEFSVWIFEPRAARPNLPDPNPDEIKAFGCSLADPSETESQQLVVLASLTRPNILRVVTTFASLIGTSQDKQQEFVDVTRVKLFPTYAQPGAVVFNLQVKASHAATMDSLFSFRSLEDLHQFQQCLTSFYVELDLPALTRVTIKQGGFLAGFSRARDLGNYGRVQIWTHELSKGPKQQLPTDPNNLSSRRMPYRASHPAIRTSYTTSSTGASRTLVDWTSVHAPSVIWRGEHAELPYPEAPLVVLLLADTRQDDDGELVATAFRILSVPIDGSVFVDPSRCACRNRDDTCTKVVIASRGTLNAHLRDYGSDITAMNIAALRRPQEREHEDRKCFLTKFKDVGRITIDLSNVQDKKDFRQCLTNASDNYVGLWHEYQIQKRLVHGADHVDHVVP